MGCEGPRNPQKVRVRDVMDWTTDLPTKPGRYFIRPAKDRTEGRVRGYVVTVKDFGGKLSAIAGPDLSEYFRLAALDRVHIFVNEPGGIEWHYIDDVTEAA
jgi:hypothetical protein